jgi:hypothetical protein
LTFGINLYWTAYFNDATDVGFAAWFFTDDQSQITFFATQLHDVSPF